MRNAQDMYRRSVAGLVVALCLSCVRGGGAADAGLPAANAHEAEQLAILRSNADPGAKGVACKRLAIYGSKAAVADLVALLPNPELASWARIALEAIPDPAVDDALRAAVDTLKGRLRVGVINSIGVRRDAKAVSLLSARLDDADTDVASASAVALGHIGGDDAARALAASLAGPPTPVRPAVAEGCILTAERYLADGHRQQAIALYDAVRRADVSKQKRLEGIRGAILARGTEGVPLLAEQLHADDADLFGVGLRTARELPGAGVTKALLAELEKATPQRKGYLLVALADRGDAEALRAALAAAKSGDAGLRLQAVRVLESIGDPSAATVILAVSLDEDATLARAAKDALASFTGPDVDAAVVAMVSDAQPESRLLAVELLAERRIGGAVPLLLKAVGDTDARVRVAAIKSLGALAEEADLPAVLKVLLACTDAAELRAAESAVGATCSRSARHTAGDIVVVKALYGDLPGGKLADVTKKVKAKVREGATAIEASNSNFGDPAGGVVKRLRVDYTVAGRACSGTVDEGDTLELAQKEVSPACVEAVLAALPNAPKQPKLALLRVMRSLGGEKALEAVRAAAKDADADVSGAALRVLCDWPEGAALPDLLGLARSSENATIKILALRGVIRLAGSSGLDRAGRLDVLKDALALAGRTEEKRLALSGLSDTPTAEALALCSGYLDDTSLKEEACAAIVAIAEKLPHPLSAEAKHVVAKVAEVSTKPHTAERAKALMRAM